MIRFLSRCLMPALGYSTLVYTLFAVDGVVLIDHNRAMAGNVTPGDTMGYPVTISLPGSYRLSGNLNITDASKSGIEILASHVTIDLNGFAILGIVDCSGGFPCPGKMPLAAGISSKPQSVPRFIEHHRI